MRKASVKARTGGRLQRSYDHRNTYVVKAVGAGQLSARVLVNRRPVWMKVFQACGQTRDVRRRHGCAFVHIKRLAEIAGGSTKTLPKMSWRSLPSATRSGQKGDLEGQR